MLSLVWFGSGLAPGCGSLIHFQISHMTGCLRHYYQPPLTSGDLPLHLQEGTIVYYNKLMDCSFVSVQISSSKSRSLSFMQSVEERHFLEKLRQHHNSDRAP